ncbi:hypothetical protein E3T26_12240 [Cryobacterium sp. TMT1-21]|uniref:Uncharacterized protein n=1 Tax=Cryobacterium shii TaxID=1259235 RepID=A0AAQ2HGM3_9MICO|nr:MULTISPECIES: hypothetical protein [Cryobacterium]TFC52227.1 hypothetical protein E3O49_02865 [Cryobacterium shii]TFC88470.1 hypothetical protein E3T24_03120 [Cryobacterium sp. TmT2-59]TFD11938.1 hypothetical protein E3T26_12240 [Cryobacterium sp. TMT1-21]TFD18946.1 hypothetical protein E3T32_11210 [Cryobacterium sp. TMT2-23]TFD20978.1 hypothetical protein E3T42_01470 [Cryobacterium sp. TMT4-10]
MSMRSVVKGGALVVAATTFLTGCTAQAATDAPDGLTWAERWSETWNGFFDSWLAPLASPGWAMLMLAALALVLARLLAFIPIMWRGRTSQTTVNRFKGWGLALILTGAVAVVSWAGGAGARWLLAAAGTLAVVAGTAAFSRGLATDRRISVQVRDDTGKPVESRTRNVMVLLTGLGGSKPEGLHFAIGSDVEVLSDASLSGVLPGKVLAVLQAVSTFVFGTAPWRLWVDATSQDNLAVSLTRHGRQVDATAINRDELRLTEVDGGGDVDLDKFVAAFALTALTEGYTDLEGLAGASSWRALGLHYVASTDFYDDDRAASALRLLSSAVNLDPNSHAARLLLQFRQHRSATEFEELRRYADWLSNEADHLEAKHQPAHRSPWWSRTPAFPVPTETDPVAADFAMHYRRVLLNYVITVENLASIPDQGSDPSTTPQVSHARERALQLVRLIDGSRGAEGSRGPELTLLEQNMRLVAATGYVALGGSQDLAEINGRIKEAGMSASPWVRYDLACMLYAQSREQTNEKWKEELRNLALEHLEYAMIAERPRNFVWKDPMLVELHPDPRFQKLARIPRTDFWDLDPLAPYREKFADLGISSPLHLSTFVGTRAELSDHLGASRLHTALLLDISELANRTETLSLLPWAGPLHSTYKVELVSALLKEGIVSAAELGKLGEQERDLLIAKVFRSLDQGFPYETFDFLIVAAWVDSLVP